MRASFEETMGCSLSAGARSAPRPGRLPARPPLPSQTLNPDVLMVPVDASRPALPLPQEMKDHAFPRFSQLLQDQPLIFAFLGVDCLSSSRMSSLS